MTVRVGKAARYSQVTFASSAAELQALLNGGQKEVILGEGTYVTDAGLMVPAGVTLRGDGNQSTIISYSSGAPLAALLTLASGAHVSGIKLIKGGAGAVTHGVLTAGNDVVIQDMLLTEMAIKVANSCCRAEGNRVDSSLEGIIVTGGSNHIVRNIVNACVRGIHLSAVLRNLVESNDIIGDASSTRGIHAEGASDFNKILHNTIQNILNVSPGRGIDWLATGASNLIAGNIFSGTFGSKTIVADPSVPATTQFVGNLTIGALPLSARLVAADLGGASGLLNT